MEEKYAMNEIDIIIWSNKIDLLALSNVKGEYTIWRTRAIMLNNRSQRFSFCTGEVTLHRLNWQRVWTFPPPVEDMRVSALSWRPDGRVLVIAYNNR